MKKKLKKESPNSDKQEQKKNSKRQSLNSDKHENLSNTFQHEAEISEDEGDIAGSDGKDEIKRPVRYPQTKTNPNHTLEDEIHPGKTNWIYIPENWKTSARNIKIIKTYLTQKAQTINSDNKYVIAGIVFIVVVAITGVSSKPFSWFSRNTEDADVNIDKTEIFERCVLKGGDNFKKQSGNFFDYLLASTSLPVSVLTIIYSTGNLEAECIATIMKQCYIKAYKPSEPPKELRGTEITESEHFEFFDKITPQLEKSKFMLIFDLEALSGKLAQNFHSICDVYSPVVPEAIIVFTLNVGDYFDESKPDKKARKFLENHWKDLKPNDKDPLITRLTGTVVEVNKEDSFSCNF